MQLPAPSILLAPPDAEALDAAIAALPNSPAVFLLSPREGAPYLARTTLLRRRVLRLLKQREHASRLLNLRGVFARLDYWLVASGLEASLMMYLLARRHFPETYAKVLRLRSPSYVRVIVTNEFPRTQVTTRLSGSGNFSYGPFRTRASAEEFEKQFLDFFQIRRCQEDIEPSPDHPGCIYGEMNMCLRPCQEIVGPTEYKTEVDRVLHFLESDGRSLVDSIAAARDRSSENLDFEDAARQHKRLAKVQDVLRLRDDLVADVERLDGIAIVRSTAPDSVELFFLKAGVWQSPRRFYFGPMEGKPVSIDQRLREALGSLESTKAPLLRERQDYLALLARWYYSSWRDGEFLKFDAPGQVPYRRVVNAIHRIATTGN